MYYDQINYEKDYDNLMDDIDNIEKNLNFYTAENLFLGKGLYFNEMFFSVTKENRKTHYCFMEIWEILI